MPRLDVDNHAPTKPSFPHPGLVDTGRRRSGSTGQNGSQYPRRPRTESQRPRCARSPRGSDCTALGHSTASVSSIISAMMHRVPAHKMSHKPPRIPPPARGMQDPRAHSGTHSDMASPSNPAVVPVVTYEYLFCLPSSERPPAIRSTESLGATFRVLYPGTVGRQLWPNKSRYDRIPSTGKRLGN
jgi:hypothetical protein